MRLLFDQNLSPRLKETLRDLYPESLHVRDARLESADDVVVWAYAKNHDIVIASKDSDFRQLSFTFGYRQKLFGFGAELLNIRDRVDPSRQVR